jgi:RNA polymerase sigma factor (sigma-70 family)
LEAASVHAPAGLHRISVPLLRLRSDDQLVALFRQGDEDAFQVIHERYRQRLFAYARQMLSGSRSDAEDAMQDVFLRAYGALRADDRPVTLRAWLYKVAHNRCIDQLRRPMPAAIDLFDITRGPSLLDPLEQAERREDLRRLVTDVRRLPEQQRSALLMREMEGLTYKELSEALVVSVPAVKSLLVRARIGLVEAIEARDTACVEIRVDIAAAIDKGVRASGRARRHMRECSACREYRTAMRGELKQLNGLGGGHGMLGTGAKVLGIGGAGSGAAAGGGGAAGGAAVVGGGAVATKVAVLACCAAVVGGGAVEVHQATKSPPPKHQAAPRVVVSRPQPSLPSPGAASIHARKLTVRHNEVVRDATPSTAITAPQTPPATDSTVVDHSNGGMLAPDETDDTTTSVPADGDTSTSTSTSDQTSTTTTDSGSTTSGAGSGPDGGLTGSTPPSAQGATAPGAEKTPS